MRIKWIPLGAGVSEARARQMDGILGAVAQREEKRAWAEKLGTIAALAYYRTPAGG